MFRGLYTAANGMRTNAKRIDAVTNNIANVQTNGFKKDVLLTESFPEKLMVKLHGVEPNIRSKRQEIQVQTPTNQQGEGAVRIQIARGYLSMEDQRQGRGYYKSAVVKRDEQGYLRTVFRDSNNKLLTKFGAYLLDRNGKKVQVGEGPITVSAAGILSVGGVAVGNIVTPVSQKVVGTINGGSLAERTMIHFGQGALEKTENPLNVAIQGQGFLKVLDRDDDRVKYSRQGALARSQEGLLVDYLGNPILSAGGGSIAIPANAGQLTIDKQGNIYSEENGELNLINTIQLVQIDNMEDMEKIGSSYLAAIEGSTLRETAFRGSLVQGYLEASNVDSIAEMVQMIQALRSFEADQKVIRSYDEIMSKAANEIGKLN